MSDRIKDACGYLSRVPFPEMQLGPDGTIWTLPTQDAKAMKVATLNLKEMTLLQAFAVASAFIAAGEALDAARPDAAAEEAP